LSGALRFSFQKFFNTGVTEEHRVQLRTSE
jgi:hypothetical protein